MKIRDCSPKLNCRMNQFRKEVEELWEKYNPLSAIVSEQSRAYLFHCYRMVFEK